jgi:hypothetical protein
MDQNLLIKHQVLEMVQMDAVKVMFGQAAEDQE